MKSPNERKLPPLTITEAKPATEPSYQYTLSLKDIPDDGANVSIAATDIGTSKDRLLIYIKGNVVVDEEFNNDPQQVIWTRISRTHLLQNMGMCPIHYMIRIGQGNGEMGETETYLITH